MKQLNFKSNYVVHALALTGLCFCSLLVACSGSGGSGETASLVPSPTPPEEVVSTDVVINSANYTLTAQSGFLEGNSFTITYKSGTSFGTGPIIMYRETGMGVADGGTVKSTPERGNATIVAGTSGLPIVEDVPELPFGKGIVFGTDNAGNNSTSYRQANIISPSVYDEFFEHQYIYFPESHQTNALNAIIATEASGTPATWQTKQRWNMMTASGYSGYRPPGFPADCRCAMDIFFGSPNWYSGGAPGYALGQDYWTTGSTIMANATPVSSTNNSSTGLRHAPLEWKKNPVLRQGWIKAGPTPGSGTDSKGTYYTADSITGTTSNQVLDGQQFTNSLASTIGWDRFGYPGFVRGFNRPLNAHMYFSDIYQATGPNARARIEIVDTATYNQRKLVSIMDIDSWNDSEISGKIRLGIFHQKSLIGMHVFLFKGDGTELYLGQIN